MNLETQLIKGDQMVEIWLTFRRGKDTWVIRQYDGAHYDGTASTTSRDRIDRFIKHLDGIGFKRGAAGIT